MWQNEVNSQESECLLENVWFFECSVEPFSENEMIKEKGGRGSVLSCIKQKLIENDGGSASEISSKTTGEKRLFRKKNCFAHCL